MFHEKEWNNGPFTIKYSNEIKLIKQVKVFNHVLPRVYNIKELNINKEIKEKDTLKPWHQASVKSHALFIWESKILTII
jgi:hypothetical protein